MKSSTHGLIQLILTAIQGLNMADLQGVINVLPAKYAPWVAVVLSALQGGIGIYNHYFNPDSTSAKVAYTK